MEPGVYNQTERRVFSTIKEAVEVYRGEHSYQGYKRSIKRALITGEPCLQGYRWAPLHPTTGLPPPKKGEISFMVHYQTPREAPLPGVLICHELDRAFLSHRDAEIELGDRGLELLLPLPPSKCTWAGYTWSYIPFDRVVWEEEEEEREKREGMLPLFLRESHPLEEDTIIDVTVEAVREDLSLSIRDLSEIALDTPISAMERPGKSIESKASLFDHKQPRRQRYGSGGAGIAVMRMDTKEVFQTMKEAACSVGKPKSTGTLSRLLKEGGGKRCICWGIPWEIL
jgi:hypothetical protein